MNSEIIAFIVIAASVGILFFVFKWMFGKSSAGIIKVSPRGKVISLEIVVISTAVLQGINAAFAANGAADLEFTLRLISHLVLTGAGIVLIYRIWQEIKDAVVATQVLAKFVTDYKAMTFEYGVSIIFDFFLQSLQAIGTLFGGMLVMVVNLWIMGKSLGQEYLLYFDSWFTSPVLSWMQISLSVNPETGLPYTFGESLHAMDIRLGINTIVTLAEIVLIGLLGIATFDRSLTGAAKGGVRANVQWDHLARYLIKYIFDSTTKAPQILEVIEHDPTVKVSNLIRLEDLFVKATDADKILTDRTKSADQRMAADEVIQESRNQMKLFLTGLCSQYESKTGKVAPKII